MCSFLYYMNNVEDGRAVNSSGCQASSIRTRLCAQIALSSFSHCRFQIYSNSTLSVFFRVSGKNRGNKCGSNAQSQPVPSISKENRRPRLRKEQHLASSGPVSGLGIKPRHRHGVFQRRAIRIANITKINTEGATMTTMDMLTKAF